MISKHYDIEKAICSIRGKDLLSAIYSLEKRAVQAERDALRSPSDKTATEYAVQCKDLIQYLRYGVVSSGLRTKGILAHTPSIGMISPHSNIAVLTLQNS